MAPKNSDPVKSKKQIDRFRETARELECDEDEGKFDEAMKRVARAPAKQEQYSPKRSK